MKNIYRLPTGKWQFEIVVNGTKEALRRAKEQPSQNIRYWNTKRGQSFTQSIQRHLFSNNEMSEIDLNLDLVSKYQREGQDKKLEKVLAQIDIDLLNSKLDKGLLFKEKITRALEHLGIGYIAQNRANASSQY